MTASVDLEFTTDTLRIRLRGLAMAGALRRRVDVPYRLIRDVRVGPVRTQDPLLWRLGGLAAGDLRFGTFRRGGRWLFLAVRRRDAAVHLALDGEGPERVRFAEVVVSSDDPERLAATIRERLAAA